jgi:pyruvate dehydrogenase (quinone)
MAKTTGDFLVERLIGWGIKRIYGYPGDGINGIMGGLNRHRNEIEFIQTRHEEIAAFMACAHAKFTGETGVCMATSGPGAIHLLNGLYDAKMDNQPVVAIVGQQARNSIGAYYQQEVDLISLFKDVAHNYVHMASTPEQIRQLIDEAFRIAKAERDVTCIIIPNDVQEMDAVESPPRKHGNTLTSIGYSFPNIIPREDDLKQAADILNNGKKVAILVGQGAMNASDEVMQVAEILGAGVAKALLGKCVLPDTLPFVTGPIGLLGSKPSWDMMAECDTFFMIGTGFPYVEFLPKEGQAKAVQIDIKARMLGLRYPTDVKLHGDSALTLRELIPMLETKSDRSWRKRLEDDLKEWWKILEVRSMHPANPINPQRLFWELSPKLPDNCILTSDSGSAANWFARDVKVRKGMMSSLSGNLATMCPGVPYALAAKINHSERVVISMVGDGAMQMLGNNGLIDVKKYCHNWKDPRFIVLVLDNKDLNQVTWEQRILSGDAKFSASQDIPEFPYAAYADNLGFIGIELDKPEHISRAWDDALRADRPVVIDAHCDPDVPTIPPHITFEQAKAYVSAVYKGDPDTIGIISQSTQEMMSELLVRSKIVR